MLALGEEHLKKSQWGIVYGTRSLPIVVDMRNTDSSTTPIGLDFILAANLCSAVGISD